MSNLISVIIPLYNGEKYIEQCVMSIEKQIYNNVEIIIIDDGSIDNSYNIINKLAEQYNNIIILRQNNQGPGKARKNGFEYAHGDFISFVDADDYISEETFEKVINIFEYENADIVQFGYYLISPNNSESTEKKMIYNETKSCVESFDFFIQQKNCTNYLCTKIFRRELFERIKWNDFYYSEDFALLAQLYAKAKKTITIENPFYYYVQVDNSACNRPFNNKKMDQIKAGKFVIRLTEDIYPQMLPYAYYWLVTHSARLACEIYDSNVKGKKELLSECLSVFNDSYNKMKKESKKNQIKIQLDKTTKLFAFSPRITLLLKKKHGMGEMIK